jgi:hypothetical protein
VSGIVSVLLGVLPRIKARRLASVTQISATLHASHLIDDPSLVYLAPEAIAGGADGGSEMDVFPLGTLAYFLFTGPSARRLHR